MKHFKIIDLCTVSWEVDNASFIHLKQTSWRATHLLDAKITATVWWYGTCIQMQSRDTELQRDITQWQINFTMRYKSKCQCESYGNWFHFEISLPILQPSGCLFGMTNSNNIIKWKKNLLICYRLHKNVRILLQFWNKNLKFYPCELHVVCIKIYLSSLQTKNTRII